MWNRKEIKQEGKKSFLKNFWMCVAVCFLLAFLTSEYGSSTSAISRYNDNTNNLKSNVIFNQTAKKHNLDIANNGKLLIKNSKVTNEVDNFVDQTSSGFNYLFKMIGGVKKIFNNEYVGAVMLFIAGILQICYTLFFAYPFLIGSKNFFIKNRKEEKTSVRECFSLFKSKDYLNCVKIMFFKSLYLFFWAFTIVGYFIKIYEYRMIPYILAENPELTKKEVFAQTKQMMKGNKFDTFVYDLSFIGWYLLGALTFGLLDIFYINPYKACSDVELYSKIKNTNQSI